MKYFKKEFILEAIKKIGWNDTYLTCLCIHKVLNLNNDSAKSKWHLINKDSLKNELAFYFDLNEMPHTEQDKSKDDTLSIIFAQRYETLIPQAEICYVAAVCFRKQGIPENINDADSLKKYIIKEFCLPPHFSTVFKDTLPEFPAFDEKSSSKDVVNTLLDTFRIDKDKAESLSLGSKNILGNSAGNLGAAYFQTLYSKMNSDICLVTSIPDQYAVGNGLTENANTDAFDLNSIEDRKNNFTHWLIKNCKGTGDFQKHVIEVIEHWLDEKFSNGKIGNLFRFGNSDDYEKEKKRILAFSTWDEINKKDQSGRPFTALNHYSNFLKDYVNSKSVSTNTNSIDLSKDLFASDSTRKPSQMIYYGVPGCGKSHKVDEKLKAIPEANKIRVVFHPEYTNADFVGQILPKVNGHVTYEFTPGPFTKILAKAYQNPNEHFYLVIEEINRGNAAAIFGDIFQLLDRIKPGENDSSLGNGNVYSGGWSQYFVQNDDINAFVRTDEQNNVQPNIFVENINFSETTGIRLPPNLSVIATMNTSDQNVFTLDNAFQRRFDMVLVRNEFETDSTDEDVKEKIRIQRDSKIGDTNVTWGEFWSKINEKMAILLKGLSSTEDKRLGVWFVSNVDGIIPKKVFAEKVLKYLWDDAFKFKRSEIFETDCKTIECLIKKFENATVTDCFKVFKNLELNESAS